MSGNPNNIAGVRNNYSKLKTRTRLIVRNYENIGYRLVEIAFNETLIQIQPGKEISFNHLRNTDIIFETPTSMDGTKYQHFEIELQTLNPERIVGKKWIQKLNDNSIMVRERWLFNNSEKPLREAWNVAENGWCEANCYVATNEKAGAERATSIYKKFTKKLKNIFKKASGDKLKRKLTLYLILIFLYYTIMHNT